MKCKYSNSIIPFRKFLFQEIPLKENVRKSLTQNGNGEKCVQKINYLLLTWHLLQICYLLVLVTCDFFIVLEWLEDLTGSLNYYIFKNSVCFPCASFPRVSVSDMLNLIWKCTFKTCILLQYYSSSLPGIQHFGISYLLSQCFFTTLLRCFIVSV